MIQIESVHIREFRGIRDLKLDMKSKSFVIWGPNGSGKSGVVDAIDFALTGDIARLNGPGLGNLTVTRFGPHVHKRDDPSAAQVALTVRDTKTNKTATLTRKVKPAGTFTLVPDLPAVRLAVEKAGQHSELTLSRREIIKFIVAQPTERSTQVQALLKLDRLSGVRSLLRTTLTKTSSEAKAATTSATSAEDALKRHLDLESLLETEVLSAVNARRAVLGADPLTELPPQADLTAGVESGPTPSSFSKASALRDVEALASWPQERRGLPTEGADLLAALEELELDPQVLTILRLRSLTSAGLSLLTDDVCPLCDLSWESAEALREHLGEKLERSRAAADLQDRITTAGASLARTVSAVRELIRSVTPHASAGSAELPVLLSEWSDDLSRFAGQLTRPEDALGHQSRLRGDWLAVSGTLNEALQHLLDALNALPDQSASTSASTFLIRAQERWVQLRMMRANQAKAQAAANAAHAIYTAYCEVADAALTELYNTVEEDFSDFYRLLNSDDESDFKAEFQPDSGKLELNVAFYGQGMFPPSAYHSEGHQDGMGVCLYLALVKQLLGQDFRFAVLDDVVMSVDSEHRRKFCELLRTKFPQVQFIITTHDETWASQMKTEGLIASRNEARFFSWNVNDGPSHENDADFWVRVEADLAKGDIPPAAARLRRNLEAMMRELTIGLHGKLQYRADNKYDLGMFLAAVKTRHRELLKKAKTAATSWGDTEAVARVLELEKQRVEVTKEQEGESWAINQIVHYNEAIALSKGDFIPVLASAKAFVDLFSCDNPACPSLIRISQSGGQDDALSCACGRYSLRLRSK